MNLSARKALTALVLLAYLAVYVVLAASLGAWLVPRIDGWLELLFFALAGIAWVLPLKPLFAWMNRGARPKT